MGPFSSVANNSKTYDPDIKRAQAKLIATRRVMGHSVQQIAKDFDMSVDTVTRRVEWAKRNGLVEDALDTVLNQLVPEALKTYLLAIQQGDVDAARDVMFGTGILQKAPKAGQAPVESVEMTIETYRQNRTDTARVSATSISSGQAPPSARPHQLPGATGPEPFVFDIEGLTAGLDADGDSDCLPLDQPAAEDEPGSEAS